MYSTKTIMKIAVSTDERTHLVEVLLKGFGLRVSG